MSAAQKFNLISVEEYLAGELESQEKHEFVGGVVYAMAGASNRHNRIAVNALVSLGTRLRGSGFRPCNSDTKVRIRQASTTRFYYPDAMVVCRQNRDEETFQDEPVVVIEVASEATRRIDEGEKKESCLSVPSLGAYLIVEPGAAAVQLFRRSEAGFVREIHTGTDAVIPLAEIGAELPLAELYEGVDFGPDDPAN